MDPAQIPLRGLHLPDAVGWWPLAPGWWVLIGLAVVATTLLIRSLLRRRKRAAARRHGMVLLTRARKEFEDHRDPVRLATDVSELLRRTMLAYAPRAEVAGLTGDAWLAWLDRDLPVSHFREGAGRKLLDLPYRNPESVGTDLDVDGMLTAARERLKTPVGGRA